MEQESIKHPERRYGMCSICCDNCQRRGECRGCIETEGRPFGGRCIAAECIKEGGIETFLNLKRQLIDEFNSIGIEGLELDDLNFLNGFYVNLEYVLQNGQKVKFLIDENIYLGNQIEIPGDDRCIGVVSDGYFLLVCKYGCNGAEPEVIYYTKRLMKEQ